MNKSTGESVAGGFGVPGAAGAVVDPEIGFEAEAGEGDAGEAEEFGGAVEGEGAVVGMEMSGTTVVELHPVVAGGGAERCGGSALEYVAHASRKALLELELVLVGGEGFGVYGEAELGREGRAGLFDPGAVDGVLVSAGTAWDRGGTAAEGKRKRGEDEQTTHVRSIHRRAYRFRRRRVTVPTKMPPAVRARRVMAWR